MTSVNLVLIATGLVIAAINGFAGSIVAARIAHFFKHGRPVRTVPAAAVLVTTVAVLALSVGADQNVTCHPHTDAGSHTTTTC
jgi:hypothetical protein